MAVDGAEPVAEIANAGLGVRNCLAETNDNAAERPGYAGLKVICKLFHIDRTSAIR